MRRLRFRGAARCCLVLSLLVTSQKGLASEKILYSFTGGSDGAYPNGLVADNAGNLYGVAFGGGNPSCVDSGGCGTVFELSPGRDGQWTEKTLYQFQGGTDGSAPSSTLIFDSAGNLYGTTQAGGTGSYNYGFVGCGTVFELSPNADGSWTEKVLYSFQGGNDGADPVAALVMDSGGNLFGTTQLGAKRERFCEFGCGTVFELSPGSGGQWTDKILYSFGGSTDGEQPQSSLIFDSAGNLYGTTSNAGWSLLCCGTVFELSPGSGQWQLTTLYSFLGGGNGEGPQDGLILGSSGNLYGTLFGGGNGLLSAGVAFELKRRGGQWQEITLYEFCSRNQCRDGSSPSGVLSGGSAYFYGTTIHGGESKCGTVFEVQPPFLGWRETVLHSFAGGSGDGCYGSSGVILGADGNLYGTTSGGGAAGYGTVFEITLATPAP